MKALLLSGPVLAWIGGVVSWLLASVFQYVSRSALFEARVKYYEDAAAADPEYGKSVDIQTTAARDVGGKPSLRRSFAENYSQPMLVSLLTGAATVLGGSTEPELAPLALVVLLAIGIALAILAEVRTPLRSSVQRLRVGIPVWIVVLTFLVWVANARLHTDSPPSIPSAGAGPVVGATGVR